MTITSTPPFTDEALAAAQHALAARYGVRPGATDDAAPGAAAGIARLADRSGTVLDTLLGHRTVRAYLPDPLDDDVVPTLVAAAQSAPTSSNLQLWSVVAVTDPERKDRLAGLAGGQEHIRAAPLLLVWLADVARARSLGERDGVRLEATEFLETTVLGIVDATLAAQSAAVAAESLGLGTVFIGGIRNHPAEVAVELDLPTGVFAVAGLVVGHPDPVGQERVKPRLPQRAVLHTEQYDAVTRPEHVAVYEERVTEFYDREGLDAGWSDRVVERLRDRVALKGRDQLFEALRELGFPSR